MPAPRSICLFKQIEPAAAFEGGEQWWLAECYATSDGPRMRLLAPHATEAEARAEMERREAIVRAPADAVLKAYDRGVRDGESRSRNRPGSGDMGG